MARNQTSIAKITRPMLPEVYPRKRLFKMLDQSSRCPVTWICGPPGSGKTTLVASYLASRKLPSLWYQVDEGDADLATFFYYLGIAARKAAPRYKRPLPLFTPEYGLGIPTFTRRYFENLCSRLKPPHILVFDNYQEIPSESTFHEIIRTGLSALPENITAVIISRSEPPVAFSGMHAGNKLHVIGWNDLKLTLEESRGIAKLQEVGKPQCKLFEWLHEKTHGWAAGLVQLTRVVKSEGIHPEALKNLEPEKVFDYFANELFNQLDTPLQEFLLKTVFVPKITPGLAQELTGNKAANKILSDLNRRNYFTEKRQQAELTYQYHPLFREFLLTRAKKILSGQTITDIQQRAAKLLETAGQVEDAAEIYREAGDWKGLTPLILAHGRSLAMQGRNTTLEKWLTDIPKQVIDNEPWLLYWLGICRQPFNPPDSRTCFEKAFHLFKTQKNSSGIYHSWSAIADTFLFEWNNFKPLDQWIKRLDGYRRSGLKFPSPEIEARVAASMTTALMIRQPHRPDIARWLERVLSLTRQLTDPNLRVHNYSRAINNYFWTGNFKKIKSVQEEIRAIAGSADASPLVKITWLWLEAHMHISVLNSPDESLRCLDEALALADSSGVHIWDHMLFALGVYSALVQGDFEKAEDFLMRVERTLAGERRHGYCHYHFLAGWQKLLKGDLPQAEHHARIAMEIAEETGYVFPIIVCGIEMAHVLHAQGMDREAKGHLSRAYQFSIQARSGILEHMCLMTKAWIAFDRGEEKSGRLLLRDAMKIGRENGYFTHFWWWEPSVTVKLSVKALEAGVETEYAQKIIRVHNLMPETPPNHLENWPWPVRIFTLGRFELLAEDKRVVFSGKVQKKPLEMLKALVALGGKDVREEQLIDALWPEADGDAARTSLKTTLHRLRQLLGNDKVIQVQDGRVTLDSRFCWVDAWAFERLLDETEKRGRGETGKGRQDEEGKGRSGNGRNKTFSPIHQFPDSPFHVYLEKAVSLYRGHFLAGDEGKPWVASPQERLKAKFVKAVMALGEHLQIQKSAISNPKSGIEKAIAFYEKGLEVDDLAEELYQRLMLCHQKLGRKADAVKTYRRCQDMLQANLGVEPSQETEGIYRSLTRTGFNQSK